MIERNPKYDGRRVFKVILAKLKPGDVMLTKNEEASSAQARIQSKAIATISGANFSHALLCTVPPTFIEAIGNGVSNLSVQNCFAHDLRNVRVIRYRDGAIADRAALEALPLMGQRYSVRGAIRSILPDAHMSELPDDQLFCSALVAASFRKAGALEFAAIDPMKVTPATLERHSGFQDITSTVFAEILQTAKVLIEAHGDNAWFEAAQRANVR